MGTSLRNDLTLRVNLADAAETQRHLADAMAPNTAA